MKRKISERGQSLVEFGISLVVILLLLAGAVEFGIALFQFIQLRDAAQEGALYGSICPIAANIEARVRSASSAPIDLTVSTGADAVNVVVQGTEGATDTTKQLSLVQAGDGVKVTVTYTHQIFMPFAPLFAGGNTIPITASVTNTVLDNNTSKATCQ